MADIPTICKVGACEKFCGLLANVNDGKLIDVKFDPKHPVTAGCGCIKGKHVPDYQNDPDRLLYPQKKLGDSWQQITWDGAIEEIGKIIHKRYSLRRRNAKNNSI